MRCSDHATQKFRGCFRYLENDAPYSRMGEERATREGGKEEGRELSGKKHRSSVPRAGRTVGSWGDGDRREKEGSSISLIRSPRRPPGFRNAKHLLLLIGQSTRLTPPRPSNSPPATIRHRPQTSPVLLHRPTAPLSRWPELRILNPWT